MNNVTEHDLVSLILFFEKFFMEKGHNTPKSTFSKIIPKNIENL